MSCAGGLLSKVTVLNALPSVAVAAVNVSNYRKRSVNCLTNAVLFTNIILPGVIRWQANFPKTFKATYMLIVTQHTRHSVKKKASSMLSVWRMQEDAFDQRILNVYT